MGSRVKEKHHMAPRAIEDGCVLLRGLMCVFTDCECLHSEAL